MKPKLALLLSFLLLAAAVAYAQSEGESNSKSFHFSSRGTGFGVQGEFEGTYIIYDDSIEVKMDKATIYVSEHCPYQGQRSINQLKFGLATERVSDGRWEIESAGQPIILDLLMSPKEEYSLYNLTFSIPKDRNLDLAKRWLIVAIQTDALDVPQEKRKKGYVYAHSCKDIFLPTDDQRPN
jgi:hypothetical protein